MSICFDQIPVEEISIKQLSSFFIDRNRDLGEYLRKQLKASLRAGNISTDNQLSVDRQFQALERISNNVHSQNYPRSRTSTATGLTSEQCKIVISDAALKFFAEQAEKGLFSRIFSNIFSKDSEKK